MFRVFNTGFSQCRLDLMSTSAPETSTHSGAQGKMTNRRSSKKGLHQKKRVCAVLGNGGRHDFFLESRRKPVLRFAGPVTEDRRRELMGYEGLDTLEIAITFYIGIAAASLIASPARHWVLGFLQTSLHGIKAWSPKSSNLKAFSLFELSSLKTLKLEFFYRSRLR